VEKYPMMQLKVSGMTCEHCVRAVTQAVEAVPDVESVAVDLAAGQVRVEGSPEREAVVDAIREEGYEVEGA
jgi:copper chaperone